MMNGQQNVKNPLQLTEGFKVTGALRILWQAAGLEIRRILP